MNPWSKISQRKRLIAVLSASVLLLGLSVDSLWHGITHKGNGVISTGGGDADYGSMIVDESAYKSDCYWRACLFLLLGVGLTAEVIINWRKRNDLEKSWANFLFHAENRADIEKNPQLYRDELLEHIKQTTPEDEPPPTHGG
jgi:hypothetical protein